MKTGKAMKKATRYVADVSLQRELVRTLPVGESQTFVMQLGNFLLRESIGSLKIAWPHPAASRLIDGEMREAE
jgi:hypothetical protein